MLKVLREKEIIKINSQSENADVEMLASGVPEPDDVDAEEVMMLAKRPVVWVAPPMKTYTDTDEIFSC